MSITVKIEGGAELARKLAALETAVAGRVLAAAVESGALVVQNDAKARAPYKTGTLRKSIHTQMGGGSATSAEADVGTDVPYARRIEYGFEGTDERGRSYHQAPRPYLRPALDENADRIQREIGDALRQAVESVS